MNPRFSNPEALFRRCFAAMLFLAICFLPLLTVSAQEAETAPLLDIIITEEAVPGNASACTTGGEDGVGDEDNWQCQEAALAENGGDMQLSEPTEEGISSLRLSETEAPMGFSALEAAGTVTAELESFSSQIFPYLFLNMRVLENGTPLLGLETEHFSCTEDGVDQTDAAFAVAPPESGSAVRLADIVFLIDTSGSMGTAITGVKNNVSAFATALAGSSVDYRLGLVQFGQSTNDGNPILKNGGSLTADVNQFKSWVSALTASGGTEPGFLALRSAAQQMAFRPGAQKIFVLITDEDSDDRDKTATVSILQANNVTVHIAANCSSGYSQGDYCNDTSVRAATGGQLFSVAGPYDQVLNSIAEQTSATYILRYKSHNPVVDGSLRQVSCTVTAPSGEQATVTTAYTPGTAPVIYLSDATRQLITQPQAENAPLTISVSVSDAGSPFVTDTGVKLFYRAKGGAYASLTMTKAADGTFAATIPAAAVKRPAVELYVTASDGQSTSTLPITDAADKPVEIAVLPNALPVITHIAIPTANQNQPLTIAATITDTTNSVTAAKLYYRQAGEITYAALPMTLTGGQFRATIPAERMTADIEYYLSATDDFNTTARYPEQGGFTISVREMQPAIAQLWQRNDIPKDISEGARTRDAQPDLWVKAAADAIAVAGITGTYAMEAEIQAADDPVTPENEDKRFTGNPNVISTAKPTEQLSENALIGKPASPLPNGYYKWRARLINQDGDTSLWQDFGDNGEAADFIVTDRITVAVIMADTPDYPHPASPAEGRERLRTILDSVNDYYQENSYGAVQFDFDILQQKDTSGQVKDGGLVRLAENLSAYSASTNREWGFTRDTIDTFSWTQNPPGRRSKDDYELVMVVHNSPSKQSGSPFHFKWPWLPGDSDYLMSSAFYPKSLLSLASDGVGTFAHELGHNLGNIYSGKALPDLYKVGLGEYSGGKWALMAAGHHTGPNDSQPPHMHSYSKLFLGWLSADTKPINDFKDYWIKALPLMQLGDSVLRYNLQEPTTGKGAHYYLFEVRNDQLAAQGRRDWDAALPESGGRMLMSLVKEGEENTDEDNPYGFTLNMEKPLAVGLERSQKDYDYDLVFKVTEESPLNENYAMHLDVKPLPASGEARKTAGAIMRTDKSMITSPALPRSPIEAGTAIIHTPYEPLIAFYHFITNGQINESGYIDKWREFKVQMLLPFIILIILFAYAFLTFLAMQLKRKALRVFCYVVLIILTLYLISGAIFARMGWDGELIGKNINPFTTGIDAAFPENAVMPLPDTDLHAVTSDGRHVGVDYATGEFENEIAGAIVSGDLFNDHEWILIPETEAGVKYYVSSHDTATFLEANSDIAATLTEADKTESYEIYAKRIDPATGIFRSEMQTVYLQPGEAVIQTVSADNPASPSLSEPIVIPAGTAIDLTAPVTIATLSTPPLPNGSYPQGTTLTLTATDNEGGSGVATTEYSLDNGATWITYLDPIPFADEGGSSVLYRSTDAFGNQEEAKSLSFTIYKNHSPTLEPLGDQSVMVGQTLSFTVSATDPDTSDTLSLSVADLPVGASFDAATGVFSWKPALAQYGMHPSITFTATDNGFPPLAATEAITITVTGAPTPTPTPTPTPAPNLISNPGFEASGSWSTGFYSTSKGQVTRTTATKHSGSYAYVIDGDTSGSSGQVYTDPAHAIPVAPGKRYIYKAWYKGSNAYLVVKWYNAAGTEIIAAQQPFHLEPTTVWLQSTEQALAPTGAVTARVFVQARDTSAPVYFDDLEFFENTAPLPTALTNPGFEAQEGWLTGFWTTSKGTISRTTLTKHSGAYSYKIDGDTNTSGGQVYSDPANLLLVSPGESYTYQAWYKGNNAWLVIKWLDAQGNELTAARHNFGLPNTTVWTQAAKQATAPAGAAKAWLFVQSRDNANPVYFDDLEWGAL